MKIKVKKRAYEEVIAMEREKYKRPKKPNIFFRTLVNLLSRIDLIKVHFKYKKISMERLGKKEPCLYLMNHSSFIDLKIASRLLYPKPYNIICTSDGFVGQEWLMRNIGCIPTKKFVTDLVLVRDMMYTLTKLQSSILMYPEASYTFDGTATTLPDTLGRLLKMLKVPVVMIKTDGAFLRDPLYNGLQLRRVNVSATMEYVLSPEDIRTKSEAELNAIIKEQFTFDGFRAQQERGIKADEPFRADFLDRVLYKCPHCLSEEHMKGRGTSIKCERCGAEYELSEYGFLEAKNVDGKFTHIPDWYSWERECVRREIDEGTYKLDVPVDIYMLVDMKCIYDVGKGKLIHDENGFTLTGEGNTLNFVKPANTTYSLYSDYYWYEIGDVICIGDTSALYYCFPKDGKCHVAKARLAAEELYKVKK